MRAAHARVQLAACDNEEGFLCSYNIGVYSLEREEISVLKTSLQLHEASLSAAT